MSELIFEVRLINSQRIGSDRVCAQSLNLRWPTPVGIGRPVRPLPSSMGTAALARLRRSTMAVDTRTRTTRSMMSACGER